MKLEFNGSGKHDFMFIVLEISFLAFLQNKMILVFVMLLPDLQFTSAVGRNSSFEITSEQPAKSLLHSKLDSGDWPDESALIKKIDRLFDESSAASSTK
jgi:hypothetical protein